MKIMSQVIITVRPATENDATAISILLDELGYSLADTHIKKNIALSSLSSSDTVLVAEAASSVIIGVISFHVIPLFHVVGNLGRITSLVVSSQWQRHGVGGELVQAAEEFGWSQGCLRVEVTSGDQREGAHRFYLSLGYESDERRFIKRSTSQ